MTIYLPDDLSEMVKEHADLNVSAVCQSALRRELARREELAKLDKGMERVVHYVEGRGDIAFTGHLVYASERVPEYSAYITRRHRIAIFANDAQALYEFDSFDDLTAPGSGWSENGDYAAQELVAAVAEALGEEHVTELDI